MASRFPAKEHGPEWPWDTTGGGSLAGQGEASPALSGCQRVKSLYLQGGQGGTGAGMPRGGQAGMQPPLPSRHTAQRLLQAEGVAGQAVGL